MTLVQAEPWLTRDKVMIEYLKTIGIEKGPGAPGFNPDAKTRAIFDKAAQEAHAEIALNYEANFVPPFFPGTHWAVPISKETLDGMASEFADPNSYAIDGRAVMYHLAYFQRQTPGCGPVLPRHYPGQAGRPLDGKKTYRLTVPAHAPVKQYWSATAYDGETHALIRETSRSSLHRTRTGCTRMLTARWTFTFGPTAPAGKESNWVPTNGRDFEILFRLYGPEKVFFDKTWVLPDAEEVK